MNEQIKKYIERYPDEIITMYNILQNIIMDSLSVKPQEIMWASEIKK